MTRAGLLTALLLILAACSDDSPPEGVLGAEGPSLVLRPGDGLLEHVARFTVLDEPGDGLPPELRALSGPVPVRMPALQPGDWAAVRAVPAALQPLLDGTDARLWRARAPVPTGPFGAPRIVVDGVVLPPGAETPAGRPELRVSRDASTGVLLAVCAEPPAGIAVDVFAAADELFDAGAAPSRPGRVALGDTTRHALTVRGPTRFALVVDEFRGDGLDVAVGVVDRGFVLADGVVRRATGLSDGVTFAVDVVPLDDASHAGDPSTADGADVDGGGGTHARPGARATGAPVRAWSLHVPADEVGEGFRAARVDLSRWTGRAIELRLVTEPGPGGDALFDAAVWGDLRVRGPRAAPPQRPHVVLIVIDTLRADRLGTYGDSSLTPHLDAWARASAVVHRDSTAPASWTLPSTASMLTGLAVHQHGVDRATLALGPGVLTLATRLAAAGYETAGVAGGGYLRPAFGFDAGFERYTTVDPKAMDWDDALALLADKSSERPRFLFLHTYFVHAPYPHDDDFVDPTYAGPLHGMEIDNANVLDPWLAGELALDDADQRHVEAMYDALVARMDVALGAFLAALDEALAGDPSLVIITSDHGEAFFEHGLVAHGTGLYEEQVRVPLLVRFPDGRPRVDDRPASLLDIVPTVLDVAGLDVPEGLAGVSLSRPPAGRARVRVAEHADGQRAVTSEGLKLLEHGLGTSDARVELYDLARDPGEVHDRAADDPAGVDELLRRLRWFHGAHPAVDGAGAESALDDEVTAQLRALGYLGDG